MPNIKSSKKDVIRSRTRRLRNMSWKSSVKTEIRRARQSIAQGEAGAGDLVRQASRKLDKAAAKGVIHKRQAARRKARLARSLAKADSSSDS